MVTINLAYTEAINPFGVQPVLTREQVWKGLQRKIRRAQDFVPVILDCEVLEEKENEVVREAHFKAGHKMREVCKSYYPTKVDFHQPNGALITNTISDGEKQDGVDLHMTYTFEWRYPDATEGSQEHDELKKSSEQMAKMAVHSSIEAMRKMASAGELD